MLNSAGLKGWRFTITSSKIQSYYQEKRVIDDNALVYFKKVIDDNKLKASITTFTRKYLQNTDSVFPKYTLYLVNSRREVKYKCQCLSVNKHGIQDEGCSYEKAREKWQCLLDIHVFS